LSPKIITEGAVSSVQQVAHHTVGSQRALETTGPTTEKGDGIVDQGEPGPAHRGLNARGKIETGGTRPVPGYTTCGLKGMLSHVEAGSMTIAELIKVAETQALLAVVGALQSGLESGLARGPSADSGAPLLDWSANAQYGPCCAALTGDPDLVQRCVARHVLHHSG
jgi:hypothetical protein